MYKTKVGDNGQIGLPAEWLEKQEVQSGNFVIVEETEDGKLIIASRQTVMREAVNILSEALQADGTTLEEYLEEGEKIRQEIYDEKYAHKVAGDA
jgi:AbrB family looped-hinge helix DNA binding protein